VFLTSLSLLSVPAATSVTGLDEDGAASLITTRDETHDAAENSSPPFQGCTVAEGQVLLAKGQPAVAVVGMYTAVLKGERPGTRRVSEPGGAVASFYTTGPLCLATGVKGDRASCMLISPFLLPLPPPSASHVSLVLLLLSFGYDWWVLTSWQRERLI